MTVLRSSALALVQTLGAAVLLWGCEDVSPTAATSSGAPLHQAVYDNDVALVEKLVELIERHTGEEPVLN